MGIFFRGNFRKQCNAKKYIDLTIIFATGLKYFISSHSQAHQLEEILKRHDIDDTMLWSQIQGALYDRPNAQVRHE